MTEENIDLHDGKEKTTPLEMSIGLGIVLIATFMGITNVKASNIVQTMAQKQMEKNDNWAWFQARNIRQAVYEATAAQLSVPFPGENEEGKKARLDKSSEYKSKADSQEKKAEKQKGEAEQAGKDYEALNKVDDQFDLCDASLALSLALMGVTAILKRWWLFIVALFPATFGFLMGLAAFMGWTTDTSIIKVFNNWLS